VASQIDGVQVQVAWLFRILDYEHWTLLLDGDEVGQLITNRADNTIRLMMYPNGANGDTRHLWPSCKAFYRWVKFHPAAERPR